MTTRHEKPCRAHAENPRLPLLPHPMSREMASDDPAECCWTTCSSPSCPPSFSSSFPSSFRRVSSRFFFFLPFSAASSFSSSVCCFKDCFFQMRLFAATSISNVPTLECCVICAPGSVTKSVRWILESRPNKKVLNLTRVSLSSRFLVLTSRVN